MKISSRINSNIAEKKDIIAFASILIEIFIQAAAFQNYNAQD